MKPIFFSLLFLLSLTVSFSQNGNKSLDLKDIVSGKYSVKGTDPIQPLPDGEHYSLLNKEGNMILKYAYKTGKVVDTLLNLKTARETKLEAIEGYQVSDNGFRIVVWKDKEYIYRHSWKANMYDYDVRRNFLKPLSDSPGKLMIPTFSPDGRMCAYVKDNNIWLKKFDYDTESQMTTDGEAGKILNGITDWVYEEEFAVTNLMCWSPDSKLFSFIKSDESQVPVFSFQVFDGSSYPGSYSFKYPKAGENNSIVSCHTYNVETKDIKKMNIPTNGEDYIPLIKYTQNPDQLVVMSLNRTQNVFNMYYVNPRSGVSRLIIREENPYYIDSDLLKYITFTKDEFIYVSEKSGFTHIYLYSSAGILQKQLTNGQWDVTDFYGIDPETKTIYYQTAEESPLKRAIYKMNVKGEVTRLSGASGTHSAAFSANFHYFINRFTNLETPTITALYESDKGKQLYMLEDNSLLKQKLTEVSIPKKEFFTFTNPEGIELNGWMMRPSGFSSSNKYPVLMTQYSGPNSQSVTDRFGLGWEEYMATQGYVVVCVDGRGTGARGQEFRKCTYLNLCMKESDDQVAAAQYLSTLPFVDKNKIAIWGWSYGGSMTLMAMSRGNGIFKAGIAVAPVTDWKLYDTVYTERYMRSPKENFDGYSHSPINFANDLQGNLLLVHGTSDDNVHYQNTLYYANALVEAGKQFDMQIYPDNNHSLVGFNTRMHLFNRLTQFLQEKL